MLTKRANNNYFVKQKMMSNRVNNKGSQAKGCANNQVDQSEENVYKNLATLHAKIKKTRAKAYSCAQSQMAKLTHSLDLLTPEGHV